MADNNIDISRMDSERKELHILSMEQFAEFATTLSSHTNMDNARFTAGIASQLSDVRLASQLIDELARQIVTFERNFINDAVRRMQFR